MEPITTTLQPFDTGALTARAEDIRDAIQAKTVSARQVGQLFCDLIDLCAAVHAALDSFLSIDVPAIITDIDSRLAAADAAAVRAAAEVQKAEAARARLEHVINRLPQAASACEALRLAAPEALRLDSHGNIRLT